ncbi:uncharacterized protein N7503_005267 [Penicillium pulvis]|uniref:uncharacterized protein n=1 Tax=Penicillium pulvis TaxID=1562058 RepID=UPI00254676EE|nr:uncharacterized protein N7503_005267 [Penicillium pulvis]KAJ5802817.1 hypothetical protein N7503_005267 [Penicillium pulvis]
MVRADRAALMFEVKLCLTFRGHDKVVAYLLHRGANVNARGSQYTTALHSAVVVGKEGTVKMLLDAGADDEIAIICALPSEADAVEGVFDCCWDGDDGRYGKAVGDTNAYTTGIIGRHPVVLAHMPSIGKGAATSVASNLRNSYKNIELALVVGICGAAPQTPNHEEILLADVIISGGIIQYDLGRRLPHSFIRKDSLLDNLGRPNPSIRSLLAKLHGRKNLVQLQELLGVHLAALQAKWPDQSVQCPGMEHDVLFQSTYLHRHHQAPCSVCSIEEHQNGPISQPAIQATCEELGCDTALTIRHQIARDEQSTINPRIHFGLMASGDSVIRSGVDRDALVQRDGVIAFEMEGAGAWDNLPCIVIKAVCDYADSHKNKRLQSYAAATAAACTKAFLKEWVTNDGHPDIDYLTDEKAP